MIDDNEWMYNIISLFQTSLLYIIIDEGIWDQRVCNFFLHNNNYNSYLLRSKVSYLHLAEEST